MFTLSIKLSAGSSTVLRVVGLLLLLLASIRWLLGLGETSKGITLWSVYRSTSTIESVLLLVDWQ